MLLNVISPQMLFNYVNAKVHQSLQHQLPFKKQTPYKYSRWQTTNSQKTLHPFSLKVRKELGQEHTLLVSVVAVPDSDPKEHPLGDRSQGTQTGRGHAPL